MTLDCTDIFCGAGDFPAGLATAGNAAAGNCGGQQMQAGHPAAGTVAQWLSTITVQTVP